MRAVAYVELVRDFSRHISPAMIMASNPAAANKPTSTKSAFLNTHPTNEFAVGASWSVGACDLDSVRHFGAAGAPASSSASFVAVGPKLPKEGGGGGGGKLESAV